tara:strand:+ start:114 stop:380 length:267 start_codon:yes stop_codon:yes gene_type:complete
MPEEVKFNEDEMKQVQNIQKSYVNAQNQFGQLKLAQIRLEEQESELKTFFDSIKSEEKKFLDSITKKYGEGNLNPETGVFTPTENKSK